MAVVWFVILLPRNLAIAWMLLYRKLISPLYGNVCRYYPSCSRYALEAYQQRAFVAATALTVWRLLRCNPLTKGGIDDVAAPQTISTYVTSRGFVRRVNRKA